jgi:hypothetical protein
MPEDDFRHANQTSRRSLRQPTIWLSAFSRQLSQKSHSLIAESWQPGIETIEQAKIPEQHTPNPGGVLSV